MVQQDRANVRLEFTSKLGDGTAVDLYVRYPTQSEISEADFVYRAKFAEAIRQGDIFTNEELPAVLKRRNIWTNEHEEKSKSLLDKLNTLRNKLDNSKLKISDGNKIVQEIDKLKLEMALHEQSKTFWYSQTANSLADEARAQHYVVQCTYYKDSNERFFKSKSEFDNSPHFRVINDAVINAMYVINGFTEDLNKLLPENMWRAEQEEKKSKQKNVKVTK